MAIRRAKPLDPSAPKPPPRAQVCEIIKRYIKEGQTPNWRAECPLFYTSLWPRYPSVAFWTHHEIPFGLNSMAWFLTEQGAATLASDYLVFHYVAPEPVEAVLDTAPQPAYTVPYTAPVPRPRTVAEFLKTT